MAQGYLIFHLNLAFSSIEVEARAEVIAKCYWPLLEMAERTEIPLGIELTGWTLQQIVELDSAWVDRFRQLLENKRCELIGSGWTQMIGPLVPYQVNRWNQRLGLEAYRRFLGTIPALALVNEMAFSSGVVDVYVEAGYRGIIMDRDNVRLALGLDHAPLSAMPTHALGSGDQYLPVLWSDSILFQRMQRVVHGDIPLAEYMAYLHRRADQDGEVLPLYCNDAEIFDYRPGRFTTESRLHPEGEWWRLQGICSRLQEELAIEWLSPSAALEIQSTKVNPSIRRLTSVSQPIPVKKQAKYNINRWAVTGRDDLWLNSKCHQIFQTLTQDHFAENDWRELCELWASDLRTHITSKRWLEVVERVANLGRRLDSRQLNRVDNDRKAADIKNDLTLPNGVEVIQDEEGILWTICTPFIHLVVNARRGLAIKSLGFKRHNFEPVIGTLPQGYFSSIELGADFYSGGVIIEIPGERSRVTDLEWVMPRIQQNGNEISVISSVPLEQGILKKSLIINIDSERIQLNYDFSQWNRPLGIVRVAIFTLLPEAFVAPLQISCVNGGQQTEHFQLDHDVDHGHAASALVSSTAAFGATNGRLNISDSRGRGVTMTWDPSACAAVPMLQHQSSQHSCLTRVFFSLCELDDTSRPGGRLLPFTVTLTPSES